MSSTHERRPSFTPSWGFDSDLPRIYHVLEGGLTSELYPLGEEQVAAFDTTVLVRVGLELHSQLRYRTVTALLVYVLREGVLHRFDELFAKVLAEVVHELQPHLALFEVRYLAVEGIVVLLDGATH
ncbi:hypothetical protein, partial [Porticoccus sp.]